MLKRLLLILNFSLFLFHFSLAQNAQKADALFTAGNYKEAYTVYMNLLKGQPKSPLYLYRVARCADELGRKQEAVQYFEKAGEKYALRNYYLGRLYFDDYRFDEAVEAYEKFLKTLSAEKEAERIAQVETMLAQARKGQRLIRRVADVTLLEKTLMSKEQFLKAHAVYLNPLGNQRLGSKTTEQGLDLYQQEKLLDDWTEEAVLPAPVNTEADEAYPFMLNDGVTLYFASTKEQSLGGYDLYMTRYTGTSYLAPEQLGFPYNSFKNDYLLTIDENAGVAYLASDRECADSMVCVYKLLWNNELKILRDLPDEQIRKVAKTFGKVKKEDAGHKTQPSALDTQALKFATPDFRFIVNDSVVYESLDEFPNEETALLYLQCDSLQRQIAEQTERLEQLREQYSERAQDVEQTTTDLETEILHLEAVLPEERQHLTRELNTLRGKLSE